MGEGREVRSLVPQANARHVAGTGPVPFRVLSLWARVCASSYGGWTGLFGIRSGLLDVLSGS